MSGRPTNLVTQWRTWQFAQSLSKRTVNERADIISRFERWTGVSAAEADVEHIVEWLASNDEWSAGTRNTYYRALRAWYLFLVRTGHRVDNPMINVPPPKVPRGVPHPISNEALSRVLATRMHKRTRVMILLYALAGMRCSEIAKMRGEFFDLHTRTVTFVGKGGVKATLPLHPLLLEAAWTMPREGFWFPSNSVRADGAHILGKSVGHIIKGVMIRAGVQGSAHSLRHWYGSSLIDNGVDLRTTQELMRHASLSTTAIYTQVKDQRKTEGVQKLDPFRADAA